MTHIISTGSKAFEHAVAAVIVANVVLCPVFTHGGAPSR
jgi:hypothetical protein